MIIIFKRDANLVHATVLEGLLVAWTPILIIAGAIFLFKTMEVTGSLNVIKNWLNSVSSNQVAQLMIVGWAFPFLIEGASGFGTPAALAAPVLVGLGFPPVRVAVLALIMNSVPVSFGAVGTPTWFGFSAISLSPGEVLEISFKSALVHSLASLIIPAVALSFIVKIKSILSNWLFILISVLVTVIPFLIIARFNYEFPALVGGFFGLIFSVILAKKKIGLSNDKVHLKEAVGHSGLIHEGNNFAGNKKVPVSSLLKASFPLWGTIILLVITRIPQLGIKQLLTSLHPAIEINLGSLGTLSISSSLVLSLENIFYTAVNWTHSLLYVPSIIPFVFISIITFFLYQSKGKIKNTTGSTIEQVKKPTKALLGALVFVTLMMMGDELSAVRIIGISLANITGDVWQYFAPYLGAVGSFFSGSATISNLTFGGIQYSIAKELNLDITTILALQSVGGAMGNMVCINNIVAVASVLAIGNMEGFILKKTFLPMIVYGLIAAIASIFII